MIKTLTGILRCPVTHDEFSVKVIDEAERDFNGEVLTVINTAVLFTKHKWFYPVIGGIPRLGVEAFIDHEDFLRQHLPDYDERKAALVNTEGKLLQQVLQKNKRTKESFAKEWKLYDFDKDKTWDAGSDEMIQRFLTETGETIGSLQNKIVFDAGCGNGKLNILLAQKGVQQVAMDFSTSIEEAYRRNSSPNLHFIQGDVQFPPVMFNYFDIVHSSGVLIHTNNTAWSFSCIEKTVKPGGKLSVWLYHPRKDFIHNLFNRIRSVTSKWPLRFQYHLYRFTIFPLSYCIKKIKGTKQNAREMMIDILDWFTPEFRHEHTHDEVTGWYSQKNYQDIQITTENIFGFNTTGVKSSG
ncbi:MAG: methyltransferase domain-containing protein [Ferruginibacter sp.]